ACLEGIASGIRRGLSPPPPPRKISPADSEAFLPYAEEQEQGIAVCLLSQHLPEKNPGGIATYTASLAKRLRRLGCTVHVVSRGDRWSSEFKDGIWYHSAKPVPIET